MTTKPLQTRTFNVHIPNLEGDGTAETVPVQVKVWCDPHSGEEILTPESVELIEKTKARHLGLLTPDQIKSLRERLGLTQKQISDLLQIGEKTWTRWENGRERPIRSINVLLSALRDGKIDAAYLESLARRRDKFVLPESSDQPAIAAEPGAPVYKV